MDYVFCVIAEMIGSEVWMGKISWNETRDCFLRVERSLSVPEEMVSPPVNQAMSGSVSIFVPRNRGVVS